VYRNHRWWLPWQPLRCQCSAQPRAPLWALRLPKPELRWARAICLSLLPDPAQPAPAPLGQPRAPRGQAPAQVTRVAQREQSQLVVELALARTPAKRK
jgi:hypothetical protein